MSEVSSRQQEPDPAPSARPEGVTDYRPAPEVPTLEAPQDYKPLSLLAILALVLASLFAVLVLIGGLLPFSRFYPRSFVVLLVLGPVLGALAAVLLRRRGAEVFAGLAR